MRDVKEKQVIFIINSQDLGGAEKLNFDIVQGLSNLGYKVSFITASKKIAMIVKKNNRLLKLTKRFFEPLGGGRQFLLFLFCFPFTTFYYWYIFSTVLSGKKVVFISGFNEKLLVTLSAKLAGCKIIWSEYGIATLDRRYGGLLVFFLRMLSCYAEKVVTISHYAEKGLLSEGKISRKKVIVVYPGLFIQRGVSNLTEEPIVGVVSRLVKEKGFDYLLQAMKLVIKENPSVKLLIIGEGAYRTQIQKLAIQLGINNNIVLKGYVSNIRPQLSKMRVFVFPSMWELEGFGIALIEAMREGLPCVAFNFGPVPEIIDDGKNGLLAAPGDSTDLADKINLLLKNNSYAMNLGLAGQKKVLEQFELNRMIDQYLKIFKAISI